MSGSDLPRPRRGAPLIDRRGFLATAAAHGALALAPAAFAAPPAEARVQRLSAEALRLDWSPARGPAAIFVASDPDAGRAYMRELRAGARGGAAELRLPVSPRPYLLLRTPDGRETRVAERLLPLQGGRNFRDLGGYRGAGGRQVRWGRIYRSGVMSGLTVQDMSYLSSLGLEVICDLRSNQERRTAPNPFLKAEAPQVVAVDYDMPGMARLQRATTRAEAIEAFAAGYLEFADFLAPQYTDMFARLVRRETPLAFNCSGGKDRTGVGAALILSVLGVPRETVVADYALTQVYTPAGFYMKQWARGGETPGVSRELAQAFARMPREVLEVVLGSDPAVMRAALAEMDRRFGGPVELAKARFGLTDGKIAHLREVYLI
jgi:protein-tyrosine phosphatase